MMCVEMNLWVDRVGEICQFLSSRSEYSTQYAKDVITRLLLDQSIDLFELMRYQPGYSTPVVEHAYSLLSGKSVMMDVVWSDQSTASFLFDSIRKCTDRSQAYDPFQSLLIQCIHEWVDRLLQVQGSISTSQPIMRTPLELFVPDSSLILSSPVNNDDQQVVKGPQKVCELVHQLVSTDQYPSNVRCCVLRVVLKSIYIFCLQEVIDPQLTSLKKTMLMRPPYDSALYNFLLYSIEQCNSVILLKHLMSVWLCYTQPWKYRPEGERMDSIEAFRSFIDEHVSFYSVLLGKIYRRIRELQLTVEGGVQVVRKAIELVNLPGMSVAINYLGLETQPSIEKLLDHISLILRNTESDEECMGGEIRYGLEQLIADASVHWGYRPPEPVPIEHGLPKQPDYVEDEATGLLLLTNSGRQQVISGERSFDFSVCGRATSRATPFASLLSSFCSPTMKQLFFSPRARHIPAFSRFIPSDVPLLNPTVPYIIGTFVFVVFLSYLHPLFFIFIPVIIGYLYMSSQLEH